MATLEKIRSKAALLVIIVGLAMLAFITEDFLNSGSTFFRQSKERIAKVDGKIIKIQEYQDRVDEMTEIYKMQSGQNSLPDEYQTQIRQSVFDAMVQEIVLGKAVDKIGMGITPEELFDMVQGNNISPIIQQMPMFANQQTGQFDKAALLRFLKQIENDNTGATAEQQEDLKKARNFWLFWEKNIKQQRLVEKYSMLLSKAVSANALDAKDSFDGSAENSDLVYAMQSYATIPDSLVKVDKSDIEKLYNQRKETFKQKESRVISFLDVPIKPSKEDYDKANADIESIKDEFSKSENVADLVTENSEIPYVDAFFGINALDDEMKQFAKTAEVGTVYGPVFENDKYRMFKLIAKTVAPDSVKISHIMLANTGDDAKVKATADSLVNVIKKGGDFAQLAQKYSADQSAEKGGELGWFTEATALRGVNADFAKAAFTTGVGDVAVVKSNYGTHIIKVTERTQSIPKYKIADIDMTVSPSSKTYGKIYNALNQFIGKNSNNIAHLETAAKKAGYDFQKDVTITIDDQTLANAKNSRQVIRWAFQNGKGKLSEIFECDTKFIIATVKQELHSGYSPLAAVAPALRAELAAQKKGDQIVKNLLAKKLTSMDAYAQAMGSKIDTVKFVNFGTRSIAGIGLEPKLNALISLAKLNTINGPVSGNNGVYVFDVYQRTKDARTYNEKEERSAMDISNSYRIGYQLVQSLINHAKVDDNRIRFY